MGIDLGTTNCSLCYVDRQDPELRLQQFSVEQLVSPGQSSGSPLLPSFCYLPGTYDLPPGALALPWNRESDKAVGVFARDQGAKVPERLVASAKSWLAHAGVNRLNPILPWGSGLGGQMLSPVAASSLYLAHLKDAWNWRFAKELDEHGDPCLLQAQSVVVTVPASFDETARELTLQAARLAGLSHVTLLEEPLAAFYCWLAAHQQTWQQEVHVGSRILVVDIGGGTSDFSIIDLERNGTLRRTSVGTHLLLGGDNMDMALARHVEQTWREKLTQRRWSSLCQECRKAKETLLSEHAPEQITIRLAGTGSSLLAAMKTCTLSSSDLTRILLEGFFPLLPEDSQPPARSQGIQEMGLPYASDPAITRHLLHFLRTAHTDDTPPGKCPACQFVLFNGGTMLPAILRERVLDCLEQWTGLRPVALTSPDLSLAVSVGAANYGLVRLGRSVRVKGGIARALFLEVDGQSGSRLLCAMPRDTEEGVPQPLPQRLRLRTNQPVAFPIYASSTRLGDRLGDFIDKDDTLTRLPPLETVLKYGKGQDAEEVEATIVSCLEETGALRVWCELPATGHRFPLTFDLRGEENRPPAAGIMVDETAVQSALALLKGHFSKPDPNPSLFKDLENALGASRQEWGGPLLRLLADGLLAHPEWRNPTEAHEARWLNLCGFLLRPGIGVTGDEWRAALAWKLWLAGPVHPRKPAVHSQWLVFWRRIAPGLRPGQQAQILSALQKQLLGGDGSAIMRANDQVNLECWRTAASLERLPWQHKLKLLQALLHKGRMEEAQFWPIARLAGRKLFHGTWDTVVPADKWEPLVNKLLERVNQSGNPPTALFALANACRLTGMRTIDLSEPTRQDVARHLTQCHSPWANLPLQLQEDTATLHNGLLGEQLPLGLSV
ncbi:MAG: Hsp70 family protein [Victivallales bacterium]|nr:Hsp70 family protein [Victivallales bacterium]